MDRTQSQWLIDKREAVAQHGMVTAMHPLAAAAGLEILRAGGNAIDAAVATAFAIGVVEPAMSGLGGVAAMVIYSPSTGRTVVVDGSSVAPAAARDDTFELAAHGPGALYDGEIGERIVADLRANGGLITLDDLTSYAVREYEPLQIEYRGFRLLGLSPTSGSMTAFEAMNMLATFDLQGMSAASE